MVMSQRFSIGIVIIVFAGFLFAAPRAAFAVCVPGDDPNAVILYENDDCEGTNLYFTSEIPNLKNQGFNDKASSLIVGKNVTVRLYEHSDFGGNNICWNGPATITALDPFPIVEDNGWDNDPSSVHVESGATCANPGGTIKVGDQCPGGIGGVFCRLGIVGNIVKNLPIVIPTAFLVIVVTLIASLASALAAAVKFFFIWFAKEAINIPVSSENPFVEQGFNISLSIVNSLFILILVIIGLATILRFQRYQFQKLLPTFFVVALLINFSGVFVGFIVDMGNILTNVFLSRIASLETVAQQVGSLGGDLLSYVTSPGFDELFGNLVQIVAKSIILLLYNMVLLIVLFVLLLIFVIRSSILSLLAALAPFAFAAYILPATKGFFEQWWKQLIQWSLIGAPITFFLYLSNLFLSTGGGFPEGGLEGAGALGEVLYGIITPLASIILLIAGIGISMQLAPSSARGVINFGKKAPGMLANTRLGAKVMGGLSAKTQRVLSRAGPLMEDLEKKSGVFRPLTAATTRPLGWATTGLNRAVGGKLLAYAALKRRIQIPKEFDEMSPAEQEAYINSRGLDSAAKVQFAGRMADKKTLHKTSEAFQDDIIKAAKKEASSPHLQKELGAIYGTLTGRMSEKAMIDMEVSTKITPDMKQEEKDEARKKVQDKIDEVIQEIQQDMEDNSDLKLAIETELRAKGISIEDYAATVKFEREIKPQDIANIADTKTLSFRHAMRYQNPAALQRVYDNFGKDALDDIFTGVQGLNSLSEAQLAEYNPRMVKYLTENNVGRTMSWNPAGRIEDLEAKAIRLRLEINRIATEITQRQQQVQTLSEGRPTATPGNRAIPRADRETIQRLEEEIQRLEEERQKSQDAFQKADQEARDARGQGSGGRTRGGPRTGGSRRRGTGPGPAAGP